VGKKRKPEILATVTLYNIDRLADMKVRGGGET